MRLLFAFSRHFECNRDVTSTDVQAPSRSKPMSFKMSMTKSGSHGLVLRNHCRRSRASTKTKSCPTMNGSDTSLSPLEITLHHWRPSPASPGREASTAFISIAASCNSDMRFCWRAENTPSVSASGCKPWTTTSSARRSAHSASSNCKPSMLASVVFRNTRKI